MSRPYFVKLSLQGSHWDGTPKMGNNKPIKINGKTVKVDWQTGVYHYLLQRREEIKAEGWTA